MDQKLADLVQKKQKQSGTGVGIDWDDRRDKYVAAVHALHEQIKAMLADHHASVQRAIRTGSPAAPRFIGMTEADVDAHYDAQRRELDRLTVLNLVASAEATVKVDFFRRVGEKLKDTLSVAYQQWHKRLSAKKQLRQDFDYDGILDVLKDAGVMDNVTSDWPTRLAGWGHHWNERRRQGLAVL